MSTPADRKQQVEAVVAARQALAVAAWESWMDGPKYIKAEIEKAIIGYGLNRDYVREDRRWFTTTVYFKVSGPESRVRAFRAATLRWVDAANGKETP